MGLLALEVWSHRLLGFTGMELWGFLEGGGGFSTSWVLVRSLPCQGSARLRMLRIRDLCCGLLLRILLWGIHGEGLGESNLLVGYHGEPKVNLFHNIRII